jgi:hypothetical protein
MPEHLMACKIQYFWHAHGRWNTTRRIGRRLLKAGVDIQKPQDLTKALVSDLVQRQFEVWFQRLLPPSKAMPSARIVLNAFGICTFKNDFFDRSYSDSENLVKSAEAFALFLDGILRENSSSSFDLIECMDTYILEYEEWVTENETNIRQTILQKAVSHALQLISRRIPRPMADADQDKLLRISLLIGGVDELAKVTASSREIRVVARLKESAFWGPSDTSVFQMMHEVLMDERFVLSPDTVLVKFRNQYQQILVHKVREFLRDLPAVLLFPLRGDAIITAMAGALDIDGMHIPDGLAAYAERLMPLIARAAPDPLVSQHIDDSWQRRDRAPAAPHSVLIALRDAACSLRFAFAQVDVEQCRRSVARHPDGLYHTHADLLISQNTTTTYTERWIRRALRGHPHLRRLAAGDPFALLRFHDREVLRLALAGGAPGGGPLPEVLLFDAERMRAIAGVCDRADEERLIRMVETQEVPDGTPHYLQEAAAALRRLVFVCRFQHGQRVAEITRRLAQEAFDSEFDRSVSAHLIEA